MLCACAFVYGHPHMFIDVSLKFMLNDSGLKGIYVFWDMDEMNSAWIIEEQDKNRNGTFEKNEQIRIYNEAFSNAAAQNHFMRVSWGLKMLETVQAQKFTASIGPGGKVIYAFYVPCKIHLREIADREILVLFDDPTIYIAFTLKKKLVQVSTNNHVKGAIAFKTIDYLDAAILTLEGKK